MFVVMIDVSAAIRAKVSGAMPSSNILMNGALSAVVGADPIKLVQWVKTFDHS